MPRSFAIRILNEDSGEESTTIFTRRPENRVWTAVARLAMGSYRLRAHTVFGRAASGGSQLWSERRFVVDRQATTQDFDVILRAPH